jgi:hypothetical protein
MTASDSKTVHTRNVKALVTYMNFLNVFFSFGASAMLCVLLGRKRNNASFHIPALSCFDPQICKTRSCRQQPLLPTPTVDQRTARRSASWRRLPLQTAAHAGAAAAAAAQPPAAAGLSLFVCDGQDRMVTFITRCCRAQAKKAKTPEYGKVWTVRNHISVLELWGRGVKVNC